jgi:vancomycin permeability regulator SanA
MVSFNLNKILPLIFFPLGFSLLLLTAALKWRSRILIVAPVAILGLLSTPLLANIILGSLEDGYPYRSVEECPQADAVFVFGGMLGPRDRADGSIAWGDAAERFDRAVRIIKAGKARLLVLSGGAARYPDGNEGDLMKGEAVARGIPEQSLLVTGATSNTKA